MKKDSLTNVLLKVTVILLIVIVSLISFFGIYKRNLNSWENLLPEYNLSKEIGESRTFSFLVDTSTKEVEQEEKTEEKTENETEGNTEENSEANTTEGNTEENSEEKPKETVPVNDPSALTKENYKKAKKIVEQRLKEFGIIDSTVDVNEKDGSLAVSVPYSNITDYTVSLATNKGKIEIIDTETKEVLISRNMIKNVSAYYINSNNSNTSTSTSSQMYDLGVRLQFNSEGQKKLNEISKNYIETTDSEGKATQKTVTVKIDDVDKYVTYFAPNEEYTYIAVPLYQSVSASEDNMEAFNDAYSNCVIAQVTLNAEELPIAYTISAGTYFKSNLGENYVRNVVVAIVVILAVVAVWMIIKFKQKGLLIDIIQAGYVAIILLFLRAASVNITLSGLIMVLFMSIINYILLGKLAKNDKLSEFTNFLLNMIPFIITILVFNFAKDINIKSVGMVGIWGIFAFAYTFMTSLLLLGNKNAKKNGVGKNEK